MTANDVGPVELNKVVVLAGGLGKRMRQPAQGAALTSDQTAQAERGVKAMIPIGRPFLDYVLSALADAGFRRACLVIGPEHEAIREYYRTLHPARIRVHFALQKEPLGTADAVLAAEEFAAGEEFAVINSDNYYPAEALLVLRRLGGPGLVGFTRAGLLAGNVPAQRLARFAVLQTDAAGNLRRIIEKPDERTLNALGEPILLSMNCWRFDAAIFEACRTIAPSPRGELEIPFAVQYAIDRLGRSFRVVRVEAPCLDLSNRGDVAGVAERLAGVKVDV